MISSIQNIKTCLKPSLIEGAGVGVFALKNIKKDECLYHRNNYKDLIDYEIPEKLISSLVEPNILKFIDRMCMYNYDNQTYTIDIPLNMLYTEYYINHSHLYINYYQNPFLLHLQFFHYHNICKQVFYFFYLLLN